MMERRQTTNEEGDIEWVIENEEPEVTKIHIGDVPIMLRSNFCILSDLINDDLPEVGECPYDAVSTAWEILIFAYYMSLTDLLFFLFASSLLNNTNTTPFH